MADTDKLVKVGQLDTIVDEIVDKFGETNGRLHVLDISKNINDPENIFLYPGYMDSTGVHRDTRFRILYVPCLPSHKYIITKGHNEQARFYIGTTVELPINGVAVANFVRVESADSIEYTTPADALYLCVYFYASTLDTQTLEILAVNTIIIDPDYGDKEYRNYLSDKEREDIVNRGLAKTYTLASKRFFINDNLKWDDTNIKDSLHVCWPVSEGDKITLIAGNTSNKICFLSNNYALLGEAASIVGALITVSSYQTADYTVPAGANYICFLVRIADVSRLPFALTINNVDVIKTSFADSYETVFYDDFNRESLGTDWTRVSVPASVNNGYTSLFYNAEDLAYIDSSCMVLKARLKKSTEPDLGTNKYGNPRTMVSGYVSSHKKFATKKGRVTVRMKFSEQFGTGHPGGFWLFSQNNRWPNAVEYDALEYAFDILSEAKTINGEVYPVGSIQELIWSNTHYYNGSEEETHKPFYYEMGYAKANGDGTWGAFDTVWSSGIDVTDWHEYSVEFDEEWVVYRIDNIIVKVLSIKSLPGYAQSEWDLPKDIRFNIKTAPNAGTETAMLYVDWVKVETASKTPVKEINHENISMAVGGKYYVNPAFSPTSASNFAFDMTSDNPSVVSCFNYLENSDMVYHRLDAKAAGEAHITITTAHGDISCTFTVTVS